MSTGQSTHAGDGLLTRWWSAWNRFWFRPTDPSTLGFMRIAAGLLVVYLHLAYSRDLIAFFGENAWLDVATARETHRDQPFTLDNLQDWDSQSPNVRVPDARADRQAVIPLLRRLPAA